MLDQTEVSRHWEANAETWTRLARAGHDVYRDVLNTPAFLSILPPISGLRGLDICCGEGANTRQLARLGARMNAIDVAPTFIRHAQEAEAAEPLGIQFEVADALDLPFEAETFDFATSFMAMMDVADPARALASAQRVLKPGGFLQFSILHPCFVPPKRRNIRDAAGKPVAVEIADYFGRTYGDIETWIFESVTPNERDGVDAFKIPRFHRTLADWIDLIRGAGLELVKLGEPRADDAMAKAYPTVADTQVAPIFLHFQTRKPG